MPVSLVLAAIMLVVTVLLCLLAAFANGMSSNPSAKISVLRPFLIGASCAGVVAASHYLDLSW